MSTPDQSGVRRDTALNTYLRIVKAVIRDAERELPERERDAFLDIVVRAAEGRRAER